MPAARSHNRRQAWKGRSSSSPSGGSAVGIFAQRAKARPNRLGVSRCRLVRVDGTRLVVGGLDAIDGTPVLDVKPWIDAFGPQGAVRQPTWATELMRDYYARGGDGR